MKTKACRPTPGEPEGYVARGEWMEDRYRKGLIQHRCPKCRLWHIWVRSTPASLRQREHQKALSEKSAL